jgi:hypothetical protein
VLCGAVFLTTFLYRFGSLGGSLGGFSNDEYGYLARARQIGAGEVPFRDFNDPGWFLTDYASAAAQWIFGYNLRSQALLTVGMLSAAAVLTFLLARRATGSLVAAAIAVAVSIALEPRHYNYPKLFLYAAGIALAWAYVDRPSRARLAALGATIGVGFLFRHDHLVYLGVLGLATAAIVHGPSLREVISAAARLSAAAAVFVAPFLVFLALNGGIGEYFRLAMVYVERDAERTSFSLPRFAYDASLPLIGMTGGTASAVADVNVRWRSISDDERQSREAKYQLAGGAAVEGTTWKYALNDVSSSNIESLVRDPFVEDTAGIDRSRFVVEASTPSRFASQLDAAGNATAFLYYLFILLPFLAAVVLLKLSRAAVPTRVTSSPAHLVPLLVLAVMLSLGFMSRGSTSIRIPDVGVTAAILLAWLTTAIIGRDGRVLVGHRAVRACVGVMTAVGLGLTVLSVNGLTHTSSKLRDMGFGSGPFEVAARTAAVWRALGAPPSSFIADEEQPGLMRVAGYIHACTSPYDRLFVLGTYPELYYFADRAFAGGHAWLLPEYYSDAADEARIVARLRQARVPIVLTESRARYDEDYRGEFELVDAYLKERYTDAGEIDAGGDEPMRVLVDAGLTPAGRYEPFNLPCFVSQQASRGR